MTLMLGEVLAIFGGGVAGAAVEEVLIYHFVSNGGPLLLWEVTSDGSRLDVLQIVEMGDTCGPIDMDPFGRFLIQGERGDGPCSHLVFSISPSPELVFRSEFSRPGLLGGVEEVLTQDGRFLIAERCDEDFQTCYIQAFLVSDEATLIEMPGQLQIWPPTPQSPPNFFSPFRGGSLMLPDGEHLYISTVRIEANSYINVLAVHADGSIGGLVDQVVFPNTQPINGGFAIRSDQRIVCTGPTSTASVFSYAVSPDGQLAAAGRYEITDGPPTGAKGLEFNPTGRSLLTAAGTLTPITRSGELNRPAIFTHTKLTDHIGVSPDGRLAIKELGSSEEGWRWGVFRVDPLGSSMELIAVHTLPFAYSYIEFIPPRTEEVLGDANADARRDVGDVVTYINHFNDDGTYPEWHPLSPLIRGPVPTARADADQDGEITEADLDWLIEFLLNN